MWSVQCGEAQGAAGSPGLPRACARVTPRPAPARGTAASVLRARPGAVVLRPAGRGGRGSRTRGSRTRVSLDVSRFLLSPRAAGARTARRGRDLEPVARGAGRTATPHGPARPRGGPRFDPRSRASLSLFVRPAGPDSCRRRGLAGGGRGGAVRLTMQLLQDHSGVGSAAPGKRESAKRPGRRARARAPPGAGRRESANGAVDTQRSCVMTTTNRHAAEAR